MSKKKQQTISSIDFDIESAYDHLRDSLSSLYLSETQSEALSLLYSKARESRDLESIIDAHERSHEESYNKIDQLSDKLVEYRFMMMLLLDGMSDSVRERARKLLNDERPEMGVLDNHTAHILGVVTDMIKSINDDQKHPDFIKYGRFVEKFFREQTEKFRKDFTEEGIINADQQ